MALYIDLTRPFGPDMPSYPGDPVPSLKQRTSMKETGFTDYELHTTMHIGTHVDAPLHMIQGGKNLSQIDISCLTGKGHVIDVRGKRECDSEVLHGKQIEPGDVILFYTNFAEFWGQQKYFQDYPVLSEALAQKLAELQVSMIGIDTPSPDREPFTIHKILLSKEILIIENLMNLEKLLEIPSFQIIALPMKIEADAGPVRVVAEL